MFKLGEIAFGDNVRIIDNIATRESGHANLIGVCYGVTTPSVTAVAVVGDTISDVALNVHFEDDAISDAWFAPELVALVDHAVGSRATVGNHAFVKNVDGGWTEEKLTHEQPTPRRRWFRRAYLPLGATWPELSASASTTTAEPAVRVALRPGDLARAVRRLALMRDVGPPERQLTSIRVSAPRAAAR